MFVRNISCLSFLLPSHLYLGIHSGQPIMSSHNIPIEHHSPILLTASPLGFSQEDLQIRSVSHGDGFDFQFIFSNTFGERISSYFLPRVSHRPSVFNPPRVNGTPINGVATTTIHHLTLPSLQVSMHRIVYLTDTLHEINFLHRLSQEAAHIEQLRVTRWASNSNVVLIRIRHLVFQSPPGVHPSRSRGPLIHSTYSGGCPAPYKPTNPHINSNDCYGLITHPIYGRDAQNALIPFCPLSSSSPASTEPQPNVLEAEVELDFSGLILFIEEFESFCDEILGDDEFSFSFSDNSDVGDGDDDDDDNSSFSMIEGLMEGSDME